MEAKAHVCGDDTTDSIGIGHGGRSLALGFATATTVYYLYDKLD